uniref:Uncharacterized protein n=1 Tax=Amorphochlora amoebiformis TaxID=1561963 RepID=A0A7S0CS06_9EUKA
MGEAERGQECKGCCADRRSFGIPGIPDSDTSVVFLGTGSKTIQESRSIPSIGVRRTTQNNPHVLLFNTGEGTHLSLLRSSVQPKYIRRILVSSLSLENILGLPSLLVIITKALAASYKANEPMQLANDNKPDALEIIGPEGLRAWIRVNLKLTNTRLQFPIRIRELRNVPFVHPTIQKPPKNHSKSLYPSDLDGYPPLLLKRAHAEVPGDSQDIFPVVTCKA